MFLALVSVCTLHLHLIWFWALQMYQKENLMTSKWIKLDSFPWDSRSGTKPAKPEMQMTRSSSVGGGVFRGTCGYPLCKEDKNCSHLQLNVCSGNARAHVATAT